MFEPNLNLLRIFDLLFEERSVSRTAQRLNLTQSAVSHALGRLREMVGDPLFTRGAGGLRPTARAEELAPQLQEILARVRSALNPPSFDPRESARVFTLASGLYFCRLVVPRLIARVREAAPSTALNVVNIDQALFEKLEQGMVDVAVGPFEQVPKVIKSRLLFRDTLVWVASRDHPLAGTQPDAATLAAWPSMFIETSYPHRSRQGYAAGERIAPRATGGRHARAQALRSLRPSVRVYDTDTATTAAGRTDLLTIVPARLATLRAKEDGLHLFNAPTADPGIELMMFWHDRASEDPGHTWLRNLIVAASNLDPA
jgi:DNA-binding transcriptional LysR family regulator